MKYKDDGRIGVVAELNGQYYRMPGEGVDSPFGDLASAVVSVPDNCDNATSIVNKNHRDYAVLLQAKLVKVKITHTIELME